MSSVPPGLSLRPLSQQARPDLCSKISSLMTILATFVWSVQVTRHSQLREKRNRPPCLDGRNGVCVQGRRLCYWLVFWFTDFLYFLTPLLSDLFLGAPSKTSELWNYIINRQLNKEVVECQKVHTLRSSVPSPPASPWTNTFMAADTKTISFESSGIQEVPIQ